MTSVAVNTIQIPVQPNAAGAILSIMPEASGIESLFASILANETAIEPAALNDARPSNDSAQMLIDQAATPQFPEMPASVVAETPIRLAEPMDILIDAETVKAETAKASATPDESKPVKKSGEDTDQNELAALMLPQTVPVPLRQIPVKAGVSGDLTAQPVATPQAAPRQKPQDSSLEAAAPPRLEDASTVPVEVSSAIPAAEITFGDATAAQATDKPQAPARDAGNAKIELPKEIVAAPAEAQRLPATAAEKPEQPAQPQIASVKPSGDRTEHHSQDRQPRERDERSAPPQPVHRPDTPLFANNNAPVNQPAAPVKVDAPLPVNPAAGEISLPAPAIQNTAATLLSVSTLRDAAPLQPNVQSMAVQIASYSASDVKHFEIRMDPAELGRVDVHLTLDDAGKAQASLIVEKPHTLELLQKDSINLERALKDAGIDLSNNGLNFSLKGQERQQDNGTRANARTRNIPMQATANIDGPAVSSNHLSSGKSGLDIHV